MYIYNDLGINDISIFKMEGIIILPDNIFNNNKLTYLLLYT